MPFIIHMINPLILFSYLPSIELTNIVTSLYRCRKVLVFRVKVELKTGYFLKDFLFLFKKSAMRATMQPTMEIKTR
jgi:hypothetical protein